MADSAASIRSIYSGKGAFSEGESEDYSGGSSLPPSSNGDHHERDSKSDYHRFQENFAAINSGPLPKSPDAETSQSVKSSLKRSPDLLNIQNSKSNGNSPIGPETQVVSPGPPEWYENQYSSTNVSVASSFSEYQSGTKSGDERFDNGRSEDYPRPLSRNSTTSGFSTTATKDGVEGKRPNKATPKSPLANVVAGKPHNSFLHHYNQPFFEDQQKESNSHNSGPKLTGAGSPVIDSSTSHVGLSQGLVAKLPPISLDEKIQLMNQESTQAEGD
ncbi:hypothetical protein OXX59_006836 [Metschnikowia pulcherrima]